MTGRFRSVPVGSFERDHVGERGPDRRHRFAVRQVSGGLHCNGHGDLIGPAAVDRSDEKPLRCHLDPERGIIRDHVAEVGLVPESRDFVPQIESLCQGRSDRADFALQVLAQAAAEQVADVQLSELPETEGRFVEIQ